jgi:pilus assembly protein FimV
MAASEPAAVAPMPPASPVEPVSPPERPKTPPPVQLPVQEEEPDLLAELLDNKALLGVGGLVVVLLVGLVLYRARKARKKGSETSFLESRLQPDSFFGASGGQRIDTRDAGSSGGSSSTASSSMSYSLSQLDAIGDVDPVAEADVYLAYGRDLQAEEILKEAMRANPQRMAIRTKLLEVYAKRRDIKGFELLATQVHALTLGQGEDWQAVQEMGRDIDPENPLYQPGGQPEPVQSAGGKPVVEPLGASTLPNEGALRSTMYATQSDGLDSRPSGLDLDLDLGMDSISGAAESAVTRSFTGADIALDDSALGFQAPPLPQSDSPTQPVAMLGTSTASEGSIDFDLDGLQLGDLQQPEVTPLGNDRGLDKGLDFGQFDLGTPAAPAPSASAGRGDAPLPIDEDGDPLTRKLELAEEFRQIGDVEGARDLLEEVITKADGVLKAKAQKMLEGLG